VKAPSLLPILARKTPVGPLLDNSQPFGQHNGWTTKSVTKRGAKSSARKQIHAKMDMNKLKSIEGRHGRDGRWTVEKGAVWFAQHVVNTSMTMDAVGWLPDARFSTLLLRLPFRFLLLILIRLPVLIHESGGTGGNGYPWRCHSILPGPYPSATLSAEHTLGPVLDLLDQRLAQMYSTAEQSKVMA